MKKLLIVFLVLSFVFTASFAFASDRYIFNHYTLFVDGELYREMFNADFGYDTLMYDFLLYDGPLPRAYWVHHEPEVRLYESQRIALYRRCPGSRDPDA